MFADIRQAFRALLAARGFSALVIIVLAIGIGANTAIFSIVDGVLLKPLPFAHPDRLVAVDTTVRGEPDDTSFPDLQDWRADTRTLERIAGYTTAAITLTGVGDAASLPCAIVTSDLFPILGATALRGRVLTAADDDRGATRVTVISEGMWTSRFGRDPGVVGRAIVLDGEPYDVVGVMPASFEFPFDAEDPPQLWMPIATSRFALQWIDQRGAAFFKALGLLRPGVDARAAQAELAPLEERIATTGRNGARSVIVRPFQDVLVKNYRLGLLVLLSAVGSVLLIACANVANLLLARGSVRRREISVRAALGASRARIIRQLLVESLVLSLVGGAAGALLSLWAVELLVRMSPLQIPRLHTVHLDAAALAFTALASLATGTLSGLVPALQLSSQSSGDALKDSARGGTSGKGSRTRNTLVIVEMAVSLVLLASAGLLVRSLVALQHVNPGFATERAVALQVLLPSSRYPKATDMAVFERKLHDELRALPGAAAAAMSTTLPMSGSNIDLGFSVEGQPVDPKARTSAGYFAVSSDYFTTLGIPIVQGRAFTERDDEKAPGVLIVNRALAAKYWPDGRAVGKRIRIGYNGTGPREIVGVAGDVKQGTLADSSTPQIYTPFAQTPWPFVSGVVRTAGQPESAIASMRAAVARVDPMLGIAEVKTLDAYVARSVATPRFTAVLVGGFAAMALLLAALGLFSVLAYTVTQRRREIGIRVALGARASDVRALVLRQALQTGVVGLAIGLGGALAATRVIGSLLFGVAPHDPATFAGVALLLLAVMMLAAYIPARRATSVDPVIALRTE